MSSSPNPQLMINRSQLVIISMNNDPIQMLVTIPFDNLKLCDSDDYAFRVDITSRFPVIRKSIELLSLSPPMLLHDPFISSNVGPANNSGVRVSTLSLFITNAEKSSGAESCSNHDQELQLVIISMNNDPIRMLVTIPFDNLKLCDSDDSAFRVDITSRFPVIRKSIELLSLSPPMVVLVKLISSCFADFFKEIFKFHMFLHDPFISSNVGPANNSGVRVSTLSLFITNAEKSSGAESCSNHDQELQVLMVS
nr:hypothetical protein [Tanacetum cinerariifolium]